MSIDSISPLRPFARLPVMALVVDIDDVWGEGVVVKSFRTDDAVVVVTGPCCCCWWSWPFCGWSGVDSLANKVSFLSHCPDLIF